MKTVEHAKEKIVDAVIEILKVAIYVLGGILIINNLKDDVAKYVDKYHKIKALREVSIQINNERTEAAAKVIRSAKRLHYSTHVIDTWLSSSLGSPVFPTTYDIGEFKTRFEEFLTAQRLYQGYSTDVEIGQSFFALNKTIHEVRDILEGEGSARNPKILKRNLLLLESELAKFINLLNRES